VSGRTVDVSVGARLFFDGEVVQVVEFDGRRVVVREERSGRFATVTLAVLAAGVSAAGRAGGEDGAGLALAGLDEAGREAVAARAGHVREVLTGYRAGHVEAALPGEPRAQYAAGAPLKARYQAKAAELGVSARTVENWVAAYRDAGEAGLVDVRTLRGRGSRVDPRWDAALRAVLAEGVEASTPTRAAVLSGVEARLAAEHGPGTVPAPSRATAYRLLAEVSKGTNAVSGSAKGRRSIADRPKGTYGRLRATRPGEYVILDTQDLDVFAMEPVTCRWVKAQLTVAQDLFSRCIVGLRVTAVSTKAVDVAGVLHEAIAAPAGSPAEGCGSGRAAGIAAYHGVPRRLVFTEAQPEQEVWCPPETLVIDHGRAFLSAHVIGVCARLGISIQPAQPKKPTDKPTVERFFRTLREGLIQHLPAYKGPDLHSRGERVEEQAFLFLHELEDVIRDWTVEVYHQAPHDGLAVAEWPRLRLSPNEMFALGVAKAGALRIPAAPELAYEFLAVAWRTIQHYGVEVNGLRYNGPVLDGYRNAASPYGGTFGGKWPIRVNPDDVRFVYFQDPADASWHRLAWEHSPMLGTAFSADAARCARALAARADRFADPAEALAGLLARWDQGMVTDRRERRIAVRLSAERAAIPGLAEAGAGGQEAEDADEAPRLRLVPDPGGASGDDDAEDELFDAPGGGGYYDDAFEVLD
jgi:transposase InsO family protein